MTVPTIKVTSLGGDTDVAYAGKSNAILYFISVHTGTEAAFPAYLTDFSQNFQSQWNQEDVFGRNDPIASFQNTKRTMSLAWDVPAGNLARAKANLKMYGTLVKMLYPAYLTEKTLSLEQTQALLGENETVPRTLSVGAYAQTLSKPPLIKIKFANLVVDSSSGGGLLGFVDGFSMKPDLTMGYFSSGGNLYPKVFSISCSFTVLHQHDLGYGTGNSFLGTPGYPFS